MNARVKRSTYYCRRGTDVLAAAVGSVWYTFVDAVSGFNQIRNTKRAREVLAIVARSGKYLPVGLTFGPVNGPDDFNFVVDRAYAPGRGRRLRFTKEWIAYVDDLTVRSGRVIDGRFYTDNEADQAIRDACSKGSVATPQSAGAALEALGVRQQGTPGKRAKHDAAKADTNHPTRVCWVWAVWVWSGSRACRGVPGRAISLVAGHGPGGVLVSSVHECMCKGSCQVQ